MMLFSKTYRIILKMTFRGYSERNNKDEQYLHIALRKTDDLDLFKTICLVLGKAGSLFSLPTLMAFAKDRYTPKGYAAKLAIDELRNRVQKEEIKQPEMQNFFNPDWWQPKWVGSKDKLISYVACLSNVLEKDKFFEGEIMDKTAERLMQEMDADLSPYQSFRELRLCTPDWDAKTDFISVLRVIEEDLLMGSVLKENHIGIDPDRQYEENVSNMRCDYLLTRLQLHGDDAELHYLLKSADKLNRPD